MIGIGLFINTHRMQHYSSEMALITQQTRLNYEYLVGTLIIALLLVAGVGISDNIVKIKTDPNQQVDVVFRLFETHNISNHLLLGTRYGKVWQVQYSVKKEFPEMKIPINGSSLLPYDAKPTPGRFTLYPTQNVWNFLLLD